VLKEGKGCIGKLAMANDFYNKLADLALLRRAWHLARNDSRTDFIFDPYRFSGFAFYLDDHLNGIARSLKSGSYYPKPLQTIDIPKSRLSVRPGSALSIEDKIVVFAIACLIAPHLDKKLPDTVYSWRLKKGKSKKELFEDHEILKYPFLKRTTIQRRLDFVEPWYGVWPRFIKDLEVAYEKDGYNFMVTSDIVAYFENIDLGLLRELLLHYLPKQPRIINFMINLLEYWSWPAIHGGPSTRGIPQGNGVSSFIGNIYLLPLDKAFQRFCKSRDIKYLRYMDDVNVMAKDIHVARDALFLMNEKLRELRLNIQGAKTRRLQDKEIRSELFDERLDRVNAVIDEVKKKRSITPNERKNFTNRLKLELGKVKGRKGVIRDKELRLFRRLITGFTLLKHSGMVRIVLDQLERNPDSRLLNSAARYLRSQVRNMKSISGRISAFLIEDKLLFQYQEAHCLMALRYQRDVTSGMWKEAKNRLRSKREHWYVRQQAALLISQKDLSRKELKSLWDLADNESNAEVKRSLVQALAQLPQNDLEALSKQLLFESDPKCQRLGRYYYGLLFDKDRAKDQLDSLFKNFQEDILVDRLYQMEVLSKAKNQEIHTILLGKLKKISGRIQRPILLKRVELIIARIKQKLEHP
jgi:hypothetical protein